MNKDLLDDRFGRFREIPLALAKKKHSLLGICLSYHHKTEGLFRDGPVRWQSINATRLMLPGLLKFIFSAYQFAKYSDIIWACSDSVYGIIGYILSKRYKKPLVFDLYDNFEFFLMARIPVIKHLYRYVVKNCDAITCISNPLESLVSSYGREKTTIVLENAVRKDLFFPMNKDNCRKILKLPQNARIIGTAGALENNRGINILFEAFNIIKHKDQNLHLAVAGPREAKIPRQERFHDLGILPFEKVPVFLNALDVGVVCNLENDFGKYCFPQKTREMMACDIPIIAAKVGSMQELLVAKPEWLYEPADRKSLSKAIQYRLVNCHTSYEDLPSWSELADTLEGVMQNIIKQKR
jgi:glycosyltransferase involved in cell wall biosynthesis